MNLLDALTEESYEVAVGPLVTTSVLRRKLKQMPEVVSVQEAIHAQVITDEDIRRFVGGLMTSFTSARRFPFDLALASIAVILESRPTPFAEEFLATLASLRLQEMPTSSRVARESLAHHRTLPKTTRRDVQCSKSTRALDLAFLPSPPAKLPTPTVEFQI